jgi:hypothetical protein
MLGYPHYFDFPGSHAQDHAAATITLDSFGSTAEIRDLKRNGEYGTLLLRGKYNNRANRDVNFDVSGLILIDLKDRREYLVIKDDRNTCICSTREFTTVKGGLSVYFWAYFPAPPETVTAINLLWGNAEPIPVMITK